MDWARYDGLIDAALEEDAAARDVTTRALVGGDRPVRAAIRAKECGVICGLPLAARTAERFDERITFVAGVRDGDRVAPGDEAATLDGPAASILSVERTVLNVLQQLSGVATLTARYVAAVEGTGARIYDTRKTTPGWRELQKYAVRCGGGRNHRMSLADMALIKDNHLALSGGAVGSVSEAVRRVRAASPGVPIEVEVESLAELEDALAAGPDVVMPDNFTPEQMREAVALVAERRGEGERPQVEASGTITLENVRAYAEAGADRIAIGALTHSAPALDLSMAFLR